MAARKPDPAPTANRARSAFKPAAKAAPAKPAAAARPSASAANRPATNRTAPRKASAPAPARKRQAAPASARTAQSLRGKSIPVQIHEQENSAVAIAELRIKAYQVIGDIGDEAERRRRATSLADWSLGQNQHDNQTVSEPA